MFKVIILLSLAVASLAHSFPHYFQCDRRWKEEKVGTGQECMCNAGSLVSSIAMMMAGKNVEIGRDLVDPKSLNEWLTKHSGYTHNNLFVWDSLDSFGFDYKGRYMDSSDIKSKMYDEKICVLNVGGMWVLATGSYAGGFVVQDPGLGRTRVTNGEVTEGACYKTQ